MSQRVICIDESGKFEEREDHARFLGGCVFCGDGNREERGLEKLFTEIAGNISKQYGAEFEGGAFRYPGSFHMSDLTVFSEDGQKMRIDNHDLWRRIRSDILDRIKEYLRNRRNEYRLFALVVPFSNTMGYEDGSDTRNFNLTDFRNPGVLYERLATGLVHNFTFYSLDSEIEKNIFRIASRTPALRRESLTAEQRLRLREIHEVHGGGDMIYLTQTDINTFKASLSEKMFERGAINEKAVKNLEIECRSIDYSGSVSNALSPFYYLADIACYYLQRLFYGQDSRNYDEFVFNSQVLEQAKNLCVVPAFFWAYEETDGQFKRAVEAYAAGHLAECFAALYEMENGKDVKCGQYYQEYWGEKLWSTVRREYITTRHSGFVERLSEDLLFMESCMGNKKAEYQKAAYILEKLETVIEEGGYELSREQQYRIQDLFLRLGNHHGSVERSKEHFRRLLEFSDAAGAEMLVSSVNRAAQIYFNQFDYQTVISLCEWMEGIAEKDIRTQHEQREETRQIIQEIFADPADEREEGTDGFALSENPEMGDGQIEWIGKLYSTAGQAYAFNRQYAEAETCFEKALQAFSGEYNIERTMGYRFHAWVACGTENGETYEERKNVYLEQCQRLFGDGNIGEQVNRLIQKDFEQARFDLYLWVKAAYRFSLIQNRNDRNAVGKLIEAVKNVNGRQHPWELIYKYLYLLCRDCLGNREEDQIYFAARCQERWEDDEETMEVIKLFLALSYEEDGREGAQTADRQNEADLMSRLVELSRNMKGLQGLEDFETIGEKKIFLRSRLTYMYD